MHRADMLFWQHLFKHTQRREVAARHLADANGYVAQVSQSLYLRPRLCKKRVTASSIQVGYQFAHTRARVARRSPLAGRVPDLHLPHKRQILGTLPVLISMMA